ncbi:MAG: extracellular solute-binding protein [Spirochaetaceae bacterium]|nr:extracellular solute-binding protein [Spirochaetaceae bacterium]
MKRFISVMAVLLIMTGSVFSGGRQSGASQTADSGLTTLKVWGANRQGVSRVGTDVSETLQDYYEGKVPSRIWDAFLAEMTRRGIKLEPDLVMTDQATTAFQTLLATGRFNNYDFVFVPEAATVPAQMRYSLVNQGRLYPINKAVEQYGKESKDYFFARDSGKFFADMLTMADGNFYWVPNLFELRYKEKDNLIHGTVFGHIRKDWLDALGLPMPKTPDEFFNAVKAFRDQDINKNGLADEVISVDISSFGVFNGIPLWYGIGPGTYSLNGKALSAWYQPNVQEYFRFMNRLYSAGYIRTGGDTTDEFNNKIGYTARWLDNAGEANIVVPPGAKGAYWAPLQIEAVPGTTPVVWAGGGLGSGGDTLFIPSASKNIDKVVSYIDWLVTDEYADLIEWGIEGYTYTKAPDGRYVKIEPNPNLLEVDRLMFPAIWVWGVAPWMQKRDAYHHVLSAAEEGKTIGYPEGFTLKLDFLDDYAGKRLYPLAGNDPTDSATEAESARSAELSPDINTYSSELATALVMGTKSLSNWDSYIADLKRLKLDELIAILQAQLDRAAKK